VQESWSFSSGAVCVWCLSARLRTKTIHNAICYTVMGAIFTGWEEKMSCSAIRYAVFDDLGSYSDTLDQLDIRHQHHRLFTPRGEKRQGTGAPRRQWGRAVDRDKHTPPVPALDAAAASHLAWRRTSPTMRKSRA
jgi:hypothetical protein